VDYFQMRASYGITLTGGCARSSAEISDCHGHRKTLTMYDNEDKSYSFWAIVAGAFLVLMFFLFVCVTAVGIGP
jgi:hypothetical protein